jgi:hypothetical protein
VIARVDAAPLREWVDAALDEHQERAARLIALAAIEATGDAAQPEVRRLRSLLNDSDSALAQRTHQVLLGAHDLAVAAEMAAACRPSRDPLVESEDCSA